MDLLARFAAGDREAFEELFRDGQADVYRWIVRIVRDRDAAEDLTVETSRSSADTRAVDRPGARGGRDHPLAAVPGNRVRGALSPLARSAMKSHPLIRAYMAGIVVPTLFLLVMMTVFTTVPCSATVRYL